MPAVIEPAATRRAFVRRVAIPAACCACFIAQCLWCIGSQSLTYDEPVHVMAGLEAWDRGRFDRWNDQPPLARLLVTAPIHFLGRTRWRLDDLGPSGANFWTISIRPDPIRLAWQTRPVNVALGLLLGLLLWTTARRLFSEGAANLALALFACSPALIAHFSLATVDGAATLLFFATAVAVERWIASASWRATLGLGFTVGGFLVAKFSAPPMILLALGLMAATAPAGARVRRLSMSGCSIALAFAVVWGLYRFHVGPVTFRNGSLSGPYARTQSVIVPTVRPINVTLPLPAPEYVTALGGVAQHAVRGQPSFLMGEIRTSGGWRRYLPIVVWLKWPLAVWLFAAAALTLLAARHIPPTRQLGVLMIFPAVFFGLAMLTNLDVGDRYVLPVYPFVLLLAAGTWEAARTNRLAAAVVVGLVLAQAADALRYAPDALAYFNAFVSSERSYGWLSDSNLDWGQGLIALREYEQAHPNRAIWLAYFGGVDPRSYGIRARVLPEGARASGTVIVSATHLSGQYLRNPAAYHWLLEYPRTTILNHTLHVFEVP